MLAGARLGWSRIGRRHGGYGKTNGATAIQTMQSAPTTLQYMPLPILIGRRSHRRLSSGGPGRVHSIFFGTEGIA